MCCWNFWPEGTLQLGIWGMHHLLAESLLWLGIFQILICTANLLLFDSPRFWSGWAFSTSLVQLTFQEWHKSCSISQYSTDVWVGPQGIHTLRVALGSSCLHFRLSRKKLLNFCRLLDKISVLWFEENGGSFGTNCRFRKKKQLILRKLHVERKRKWWVQDDAAFHLRHQGACHAARKKKWKRGNSPKLLFLIRRVLNILWISDCLACFAAGNSSLKELVFVLCSSRGRKSQRTNLLYLGG